MTGSGGYHGHGGRRAEGTVAQALLWWAGISAGGAWLGWTA